MRPGKLGDYAIQQLQDKVNASDKMLNQYEDAVLVSIMKLSAQWLSPGGVADLANKLSDEIDEIKSEKTAPVEQDDDIEYVLEESDYGYKHP